MILVQPSYATPKFVDNIGSWNQNSAQDPVAHLVNWIWNIFNMSHNRVVNDWKLDNLLNQNFLFFKWGNPDLFGLFSFVSNTIFTERTLGLISIQTRSRRRVRWPLEPTPPRPDLILFNFLKFAQEWKCTLPPRYTHLGILT